MNKKLKPCPFCGGEAQDYRVTDYPKEVGKRYSVICNRCGARITTTYQQRTQAIHDWNTRAGEDVMKNEFNKR